MSGESLAPSGWENIKPPMLQDIEIGKALELEGLIGAVIEMARLTGTAVPYTEAVYALIRLIDHTVQSQGLYVKALPKDS